MGAKALFSDAKLSQEARKHVLSGRAPQKKEGSPRVARRALPRNCSSGLLCFETGLGGLPALSLYVGSVLDVDSALRGRFGCGSRGCGHVLAGCGLDTFESAIFFAILFHETAGHEILELFVSTEAKHFFAATDGIALFQIFVDQFEKVIKTVILLFVI